MVTMNAAQLCAVQCIDAESCLVGVDLYSDVSAYHLLEEQSIETVKRCQFCQSQIPSLLV